MKVCSALELWHRGPFLSGPTYAYFFVRPIGYSQRADFGNILRELFRTGQGGFLVRPPIPLHVVPHDLFMNIYEMLGDTPHLLIDGIMDEGTTSRAFGCVNMATAVRFEMHRFRTRFLVGRNRRQVYCSLQTRTRMRGCGADRQRVDVARMPTYTYCSGCGLVHRPCRSHTVSGELNQTLLQMCHSCYQNKDRTRICLRAMASHARSLQQSEAVARWQERLVPPSSSIPEGHSNGSMLLESIEVNLSEASLSEVRVAIAMLKRRYTQLQPAPASASAPRVLSPSQKRRRLMRRNK